MSKPFDVTVVLNIHREALYLRPTLMSLDACAAKAAEQGISTELVAVFDDSDDATKQVYTGTTLNHFCHRQLLEVANSSLGPSRNAGIAVALGEYIWITDADDLYSSNSICRYMAIATSNKGRDIVLFPDYLIGFGEKCFVVRYFDSSKLAPADFAAQHSYLSNLFISNTNMKQVRYLDLPVSRGLAYEDWHLNCQLYALGFSFLTASNVILFYRQRSNSLLQITNQISSKLTPHSFLFDPEYFIRLMQEFRSSINDWPSFEETRKQLNQANNTANLLASSYCRVLLQQICRIEPEVDLRKIEESESWYCLPYNACHWGFELESLFLLIGDSCFTDVVILPWLRPGGGEKYILQVIDAIRSLTTTAKILVVAGERAPRHEWLDRLSDCDSFIDLCNAFPGLADSDRDALLIRALFALAVSGSRLHLKTSAISHRLMDRFGQALSDHFKIIYYRFCDDHYLWDDQLYVDPGTISFLRRHLELIHLVIADCESIISFDQNILAPRHHQYQLLCALCESPNTAKVYGSTPDRRLLWASRICGQKNPVVLSEVSVQCRSAGLDVAIDVYGNFDPDYMNKDSLFSGESLTYCGEFSCFSSLDLTSYDALIYTSHFDGMPNIILEAMASGLLVVAPCIGGVREVLSHLQTGILVTATNQGAALAKAYVRALKILYSHWSDVPYMTANARYCVENRHGRPVFLDSVRRIFFADAEQHNDQF